MDLPKAFNTLNHDLLVAKAFDTLNHDLLVAKLHAYGFDRSALKLIKSYLTNRWQRTKVNSSVSSWICNYADNNTLHTCDLQLDKPVNKLEGAAENALLLV